MSDENKTSIDVVSLFEDVSQYILKKYPTISVFNMEELIALMLLDDDAVAHDLAPEAQTETLYKTTDRLLFTSGNLSNSLIRVCTILNLYFESIKKFTEEKEKKEFKTND